MALFPRRFGISATISSQAAFAALLAAPLMVSPLALTPAQAQTTTSTGSPAAHQKIGPTANPSAAPGTVAHQGETVDQRIATLHRELKITPNQEKDWDAVAQAMRDNAGSMQQLADQAHSRGTQDTTALDDLDTYQKFAQAHADGVKNLIGPFTTLYNDMSDTQKKNADQVFNNFRRQAQARRQQTDAQSRG